MVCVASVLVAGWYSAETLICVNYFLWGFFLCVRVCDYSAVGKQYPGHLFFVWISDGKCSNTNCLKNKVDSARLNLTLLYI